MLNSPAHPCRYRRFACPLTGANARLAEKRGSVTPSFRGTCTPYLLPVRLAHQTRARLSEDQLGWLGKLPFSINYAPEHGHDFHIFHGTPDDIGDDDALPLRLADDEVKEKIKGVSADVMAHGHIHGPYVRQVGNQTIVCVAAVGMQWDGDPRPSYGVVEYLGGGEWRSEAKRVEFDCEEQARVNENCWIEHGGRIAGMIRTGRFWNPDHIPH